MYLNPSVPMANSSNTQSTLTALPLCVAPQTCKPIRRSVLLDVSPFALELCGHSSCVWRQLDIKNGLSRFDEPPEYGVQTCVRIKTREWHFRGIPVLRQWMRFLTCGVDFSGIILASIPMYMPELRLYTRRSVYRPIAVTPPATSTFTTSTAHSLH
jgi:hypothetical protein